MTRTSGSSSIVAATNIVVLLLRLRDESPSSRVRVVKAVLAQYGDRLEGHFTVATEGGVRIRPARELS